MCKCSLRMLLTFVCLISPVVFAAENGKVIWQIGKADRRCTDLAVPNPVQLYPQMFPKDVQFIIGTSDAAKDFSAIHPGPEDHWAGNRQHPFVITFDMGDETAKGTYLLEVDLADTHGNLPPTLRVDVNGSSADVVLERGAGDVTLVRPEAGKPRKIRYLLGPKYLKAGANRIELRALSGSWLLYDAITLSEMSADAAADVQMQVQPSIFFVERDGKLLQELQVSVTGVPRDEPVKIEVRSGVDLVGQAQLTDAKLGTIAGVVHVDEATQPRQLTVTASAAGQTRTTSITQVPLKKWRIFVAPSVHTDIGYTDIQSKVIAVHNRNTDLALELIREFPLYHWNLESSWAAQMWFRDALPYRHEALLKAARERRIGIETSYLNMLTGLCSQEELIRNMYYSARLHRLYGVPFESFTITDAPSHVWSVPSIIAGAGVRCLSVGVNQTRAPLFKKDIHLKSPFWWEGPDGGRVLTWFTAGYSQAGRIGLNDGFERMRTAVAADLEWWSKRQDYPYDAILLHGAYSDNVAGTKHIAESITEYTKHYAYPKVVLCANNDFFSYIESNFADKIPTVRGCGGSWWEDGAGSTAVETGICRVSHQEAVTAEAVYAALKMHHPGVTVPQDRFDRLWDNILLFDEHTWGAYNSISAPTLDFVARQWAVKAEYATAAADEAARLIDEGLHDLGGLVDAPADSVLVFNPSGRPRSGAVEAVIPRGKAIADETGVIVSQQVVKEDLLVPVGVTFFAKDVPAVGYRTYKLVPAPVDVISPPKRFDGKVFENTYYRITFDAKTGGIASLFDKQLNKELVDQTSPYKLGQLIYAAGGEETKGQTQLECPNPNKIEFRSPTEARLESRFTGAVFSSVRSIFPMPMFPWAEVEVILYENEKRVDFEFRLTKSPTFDKEAVYLAFPIAGANPHFRYEVGGGNVRPNEDHFPGACRDWFAVQRWVTVHTDDAAVAWSPVDTPLITLCQMTPGNWLDELPITNGTIFAYAMNNYWLTNYKAGQDGNFRFRYSLTSDKTIDPAAATIFGDQAQAPMKAIVTTPGRIAGIAGNLLPATMSFCRVEPANVEVTVVKPADDGKGVIVRLHETGGVATEAVVTLGQPSVKGVSLCDVVERDQTKAESHDGKVRIALNAYATATLRVE